MRDATRALWLWAALLAASAAFWLVGIPYLSQPSTADPLAFRIDFVEERIHVSVDWDGSWQPLDVAAAPPGESPASR